MGRIVIPSDPQQGAALAVLVSCYPEIEVTELMEGVELRSARIDDIQLTGVWLSTIANEALFQRAEDHRTAARSELLR